MKLKNKIISSEPKVIWNLKCILGEGTLWVKEHNSIYFVDIKKKKIFILNNKTNKKKIIKSITIEKNIKLNRINDGKTDPIGRLWFGTMDNLERNIKKGSLYCLDKTLNLIKVDSNYYITNGPAFIDASNFYHTDSRARKIYKIKIDKNLKITQKKIFKIFNKREGVPDGMTVDVNKNLWVAHFHGAKISVFNQRGEVVHIINLQAKNITNCAFGGHNNSELFVTTALKSMNKGEIKKYKNSGNLFKIKTNTRGIEQKKYNIRL